MSYFDLDNLSEYQFVTHDNGGRPFIVEEVEKTVKIYKQYSHHIYIYLDCIDDYEKVFYGINDDVNDFCEGNSILVKINKFKYISIGESVFSFETDEEITKYISNMGNSDVPYPVAYSKDNAYLITEKVYFPKSLTCDEDEYGRYYEYDKTDPPFDKSRVKGFGNVVIIQSRLW